VNIIGEGVAFGEKAMYEEKGKRMASMVCLEECECLVIFREDFV
jgi:CRP-like cAMP-binding protein